ncbi:hypothetical protein VTK56DRAFT_3496 [Thermocarpiscus australiensis]
MLAGGLYYAYAPDRTADRMRAKATSNAFNLASTSGEAPRRKLVELWKAMLNDATPLPPAGRNPRRG